MRKWIERQRNILDFTLSSLLRRKWRNTALVLVYVLIVSLLASVMFFLHAVRKEAGIVLQNAPEVIVQRSVAGRHDPIPLSYMEKLRNIAGVSFVQRRLWGYYYDSRVGANYPAMAPEQTRMWQFSIRRAGCVSRNHSATD